LDIHPQRYEERDIIDGVKTRKKRPSYKDEPNEIDQWASTIEDGRGGRALPAPHTLFALCTNGREQEFSYAIPNGNMSERTEILKEEDCLDEAEKELLREGRLRNIG
jgi:hypothetical protein